MEQRISNAPKKGGDSFVMAGWHVDPASLRISNNNKNIKLEPKAMAVLDYLACRPGTVVSRQELEEEVWAGTIVGYDALSNAIIKLSKAFGDKARNPHIIETIAKTGYRLIAEVSFDVEVEQPSSIISQPEMVYSVAIDDGNVATSVTPAESRPKRRRWTFVSATAVLFLMVMGVAYWWQTWIPDVEPASLEKMAFPLPDKPSIAVLPFANISDDAQQEYFADGMTEDLITDISKIAGLFVIARNSVFTYKGKAVKVRQVAEELGVRYVMEGSVRRVGNQVRINAQLIDATTGGHVWAERYDGSLDDVLAMQDKITRRIVTALAVTLTGQEQGSRIQAETGNSEAYDAFLRGWERYRQGTPGDLNKAVSYFKQAIELDPGYARAYSALAAVDWKFVANGWWDKNLNPISSLAVEQSRLSLNKAMEHPSALTHQVASERAAYFYRKPDRALAEAGQAIALDANDPAGHLAMANALLKADRADEAIEAVRTAMRLDPFYPTSYLTRLGQVQFAIGEYEDAAKTLLKATNRNPEDNWIFVYLAATYGQLGKQLEAKQAVENANALRAKEGWGVMTSQNVRERNRYGGRNYFQWVGDYQLLREGLRKAGVTTEADWHSLISLESSGREIKGATTIDAATAKKLHESGVPFIDVSKIWLQVRIPGAYFLDEWTGEFNEIRLAAIVDKNKEVVIYDSKDKNKYGPVSTARAVSWGFENVYYFRRGLDQWKAAGYPVETGKR